MSGRCLYESSENQIIGNNLPLDGEFLLHQYLASLSCIETQAVCSKILECLLTHLLNCDSKLIDVPRILRECYGEAQLNLPYGIDEVLEHTLNLTVVRIVQIIGEQLGREDVLKYVPLVIVPVSLVVVIHMVGVFRKRIHILYSWHMFFVMLSLCDQDSQAGSLVDEYINDCVVCLVFFVLTI